MSHFYGTMKGGRAAVTRTGHAASGITAHVRGWNFGVRTRAAVMHHDGEPEDIVSVTLTAGSNGAGHEVYIGTFGSDESPESIAITLRTAADRIEREARARA